MRAMPHVEQETLAAGVPGAEELRVGDPARFSWLEFDCRILPLALLESCYRRRSEPARRNWRWPRRVAIGARGMAAYYQIRVKGHLDLDWSAWFDGFAISHEADGCTTIAGPVADQAALYGLIRRPATLAWRC